MTARVDGRRGDAGFSVVDVTMALGLTLLLSAFAAPLTTRTVDELGGRNAAAYLAAELRLARLLASSSRRTTALVFDRTSVGRWVVKLCSDGNGNGVRRAEIARNIDGCQGEHDIGARFSGTTLAVLDGIPGPDQEAMSADPVRFGTSDMASCSPDGGCTPGTVFVQSRHGSQFAARLGSMTGRARVLRYERATRRWSTE